MKNIAPTTILVFEWGGTFDSEMKTGSTHAFAHANDISKISPYDRVLIAGAEDAEAGDGSLWPTTHCWLFLCKLLAATSEELTIRILVVYEKLLLSDIDALGSSALQLSARNGGEIQTVSGQVRVLAPLPIGKTNADKVRQKILRAGAQEREFGAARRKVSASWRIGQNPGKKS